MRSYQLLFITQSTHSPKTAEINGAVLGTKDLCVTYFSSNLYH